jgi:NADH-quinone oxidoreductase subunit N
MGKLYLIEAAVDGDYTWLAVLIAIGTMISLVYYLRVIAAMWMRPSPRRMPVLAGASPEAGAEADELPAPGERLDPVPGRALRGGPSGGRCALLLGAMGACAAATVVFGILPSPLVDFANHAGAAIDTMLGV